MIGLSSTALHWIYNELLENYGEFLIVATHTHSNKSFQKKDHKNQATPHRINEDIDCENVRLVDENGNSSEISTAIALKKAEDLSLDLVEIAPNANPPVVQITDYKKFLFDLGKKEKQKAKNQRENTSKLHEMIFNLTIDEHDIETKMKKIVSFLQNNDHVRVSVKMRGRELGRPQDGIEQMKSLISNISARIDIKPIQIPNRIEGKLISVTVVPSK